MTLSELIDVVMVNSGEYIIQTFDRTQLNKKKFWESIVRPQLTKYAKYKPVTRKFNLYVPGTWYEFSYPEDVPVWISSLAPLYNGGLVASLMAELTGESSLRTPITNLWRYEAPKLFVMYGGTYDTTAHYNYGFTATYNAGNTDVVEVTIPDLGDDDTTFFDMVLGKFMIAVGRSRSAFTLNDLPITMDSADMISAGNDIYSTALEGLYDNAIWYQAYGD